jgi:hypothetical protein
MADEALLGILGNQDLLNFNQQTLQSDPYGMAGGVLGSWRPNTQTWDTGTATATAFAQSFLSGLLGNYARQRATEQTNQVIGLLPQLRANPSMVVAPEGVNENAFALLKANAVLNQQAAEAKRALTLEEMLRNVGIEGMKEEIRGKIGLGNDQKLEMLKAQLSGDPLKQAAVNELAASQGMPTAPRELSSYEQALAKYKDPELARAAVKASDPAFLSQTDIAKEKGAGQAIDRTMAYIDAQYAQAAKLTGKEAAKGRIGEALIGIPTEQSAAMDRIAETSILQFDSLLGREVNSDVRQRLIDKFGPKWFDSPETVTAKRDGLKAALRTLVAPSPLTSGASVAPSLDSIAPMPAAPALDQATYNSLRAQGLSPAEIRSKYGG